MRRSLIILLLCVGCHRRHIDQPMFEVLDASRTGLSVNNHLTPTTEFNVLKYMYFYNGAGVGAGDFNNDGKIDLFFASNQGKDRLYLNQGDLRFRDVTDSTGIPQDGGWSTGVSVVDINNDGLLDIYICRVSNLGPLHGRNQLLICTGIDKNGVPHYVDKAHEYGLDFSGFSTQALFFDYDGDGDLDMYLLNHSIHQNGNFGQRARLDTTPSPFSGDRLYRNDGNGKFTDVTRQAGIRSSVIGYGLGVAASDIDLDGYPDLYVCNDFHENDYLYINQHNGTFKDDLPERMMHTSEFSMGVDIADADNDGYPDIITMDMLPSDPYILKRSLGEDDYDYFYDKIKFGYFYQYTRNNLQWNRRNGMFSEAGLYAGVYATDWSWAPLWMDFDNDGKKDLFITNGIPKRLNDIDYLDFVSSEEVQDKMLNNNLDEKALALIKKFPEIKIPNKFFVNGGNMHFQDAGARIQGEAPTYSNGAVYADFDGDGDLDLVVSNIDDDALLYRNTANDRGDKPFMELTLKGPPKNINAVGAKVIVFPHDSSIRVYEKFPVRGFLSSMEGPVHVGLAGTPVDSIVVVWPDNTWQRVAPGKPFLTVQWTPGLRPFDYGSLRDRWKNPSPPVEDITRQTGLSYLHRENTFPEFDREPLLPHMLSTEGPALAVGDVNHDGLEDVFIGASKWEKPAVFLQQAGGTFRRVAEPALDQDSAFEDVDAAWVDVNGDGRPDLVVASGGNEFYGPDPHLAPRVYLGDGEGHFTRKGDAFDGGVFVNASCVAPCDFNRDGAVDLFVGSRDVPWAYGQIPRSYLLENDGTGKFRDVTDKYCPGLSQVGFVTKAIWCDLDHSGEKDLVVCLEWGGIVAFMNHHGRFTRRVLSDWKGWWNFVLPVDLDHSGRVDLIAGNLGLNSRLKASPSEPVRLYYADFDDNGTKDQVLSYYLNGKEIPFANKDELERQMPGLKKRYLYAADFANATLADLLGKDKLASAEVLSADYFPNAVLRSDGTGGYSTQALPWQAQLTPYRDAAVIDTNGDILLVGNYYENNIQMGRYDADFGTILLNGGHGRFRAVPLNGLVVKGQVRHVLPIRIAGRQAFLLAKNNDSLQVIRFR